MHPQQSINLLLVPSLRNVKRAGDDQSGSIKGQLNAESFYHWMFLSQTFDKRTSFNSELSKNEIEEDIDIDAFRII